AGKIINDAELPAAPARPSVPLFLASGGMVGLLLGVGTGLVRERTDKRVRRAADVPRRATVPVLGVLPTRLRPRLDDVYPAGEPTSRTFDRLRNEALASLADDQRVIVVTGASRGLAATLVAANLAAAPARTGTADVVVEAPSAAVSADAQSLASHADTAILAVELRRTRHAEIVDAAEQLRRVGTPVLGAVVFPRLRKPLPVTPVPAAAADQTV